MMKDPITQAIQEQKERTLTPTHKTRLKPLARGPKKSVLEPKLKNFNPLKHPPIIKKHFKMAAPFIEGDRIGGCAIARNDPRFQLD
ncbi:zormin, isoform C [Helicobacter pylori]|nr:zormin, isoform C [Helicobacter pylori]